MQAVHPFVETLRIRTTIHPIWPRWEDVRCLWCGAEMTFAVNKRRER
jgi:hypothetical protein